MEILRSLEAAARLCGPSAVTIGAFDGIHVAHQKLLQRVCERAGEYQAASAAITFDPHPVQVLAPHRAPKLLTPLPIKLELMESSGIDRLLVIPFTEEFSLWSAEKFAKEILAGALQAKVVVIGPNFRFGHRQSGTPQVLQELGIKYRFEVEIFPEIALRNVTVSSSQIRGLLEQGNIALANRLLGRCFSVRNAVEPGLGIGRSQTVPTLNLGSYDAMLPAAGVYVTSTTIGSGTESNIRSRQLRSVTNVGRRPTFGERELGFETHLLEPWEGAPPAEMEVSFLHRLRDERKFDSAQELKAQIMKDIHRAESYFRRLKRFGSVRMTASEWKSRTQAL